MAKPCSWSVSERLIESVSVSIARAYASDRGRALAAMDAENPPWKSLGGSANHASSAGANVVAVATVATAEAIATPLVSSAMLTGPSLAALSRWKTLRFPLVLNPGTRAVRVLRAAPGASRVTVGAGTVVAITVRVDVVRIVGMFVVPVIRSR